MTLELIYLLKTQIECKEIRSLQLLLIILSVNVQCSLNANLCVHKLTVTDCTEQNSSIFNYRP